MSDYTKSNALETNFEMLSIPDEAFNNRNRKLCLRNISSTTTCYLNTIYFTVLIMQFFIIYIVFAVYSNDFNILLNDAKTNMKDFSMLLPEVSNVLQIVKQICEAPEYASYCHDNISNY